MPQKGDINPQTGLPYAVNPATGQWDDNYWASTVEPSLRNGGGNSGGFSSAANTYGGGYGGGNGDVMALAQQIASFSNQSANPVYSSLSERYKALLDDVGQQASRELGARGIPLSSDSAQNFIKNRQLPFIAQQNADLSNFGYQNNQSAINAALALAQLQQQNYQFNQQMDFQRQQQAAMNKGSDIPGLTGSFAAPTSKPPTGTPSIPTASANFKPIQSTNPYTAVNQNPYSGSFSPQNISYAANLVGNTASKVAAPAIASAQSLLKSQPVQNAYKTATNIGSSLTNSVKNITSSAGNYFKSLFG